MSCLPLVKHLIKFGRKLSNMASKIKVKSIKYNALNSMNNSKHPAHNDTENDNYQAGSYSSLSSGYISPKLSEASFDNFSKFENKQRNENNLSSCFNSFNLDEESTAFPKHSDASKYSFIWEKSVDALFDPTSKQFINFENFVESSYNFSDCSLFSYSPLSSLQSISIDQIYNDLYYNDLNYQMQQECIRKEFEMNGKIVEEPQVEQFFPQAMSTPFVERKIDSYKFNYSNSSEPTKVKSENIPSKNQFRTTPVPFQCYNSLTTENEDLAPLNSIYSPPHVVPLVPIDNKAENRINRRKRDHQCDQSQNVLKNQLPITINSNQKFGLENKKKMDKNSNKKKKMDDHCVFCKNNGAEKVLYESHTVKDSKGRVLCPKLRAYKCPICGQDGDQSHTVKYCPKKPIITLEDTERMEATKKIKGHASNRI